MRTIRATLDISRLTRPELEREIRRLAKTANSRLTTIETAKDGRYTREHVYQEVYTKAIQGNTPWIVERDSLSSGYGVPRFTTKVSKMTQSQLRQELADLQRFINSKTSTVKGIQEYHHKAYESFLKKYGEDADGNIRYDPSVFTYDIWETLFVNSSLKLANEMYASASIYDAIYDGLASGIDIEDLISRLNDAVETAATSFEAYEKIAGRPALERYRDKGWNDANAKGWG